MPASASAVRATVKALRDASPDDGSDAGTSKAVKTILNSRKCWRNMKGKEEAVWPPELESALIEGVVGRYHSQHAMLTNEQDWKDIGRPKQSQIGC